MNENPIQAHEPGTPDDWVNNILDVNEGGKRSYTVYLKRALGVPYRLSWDFDAKVWHDERGKEYAPALVYHRFGIDAHALFDEPQYITGSAIKPGYRKCLCDSTRVVGWEGGVAKYCPDCGAVYEAIRVAEGIPMGTIWVSGVNPDGYDEILDARREQRFGGSL